MKYRLKELAMLCWDEDESGFTFKREAYTSMFVQEFNTLPIGEFDYESLGAPQRDYFMRPRSLSNYTEPKQTWDLRLILNWIHKTKNITNYCNEHRKINKLLWSKYA
jgi:hypothetical protein